MIYPYENLENFTLPALLDRSLELFAKNDSFAKASKKAMSYEEFNKKIHDMVELLQHHGIQQGDKVLLLSENSPNWGIAYFAVTYFGAVIVPVLPDFHPSDIHHIMRHSEVKAVFVSTKHQTTIEECQDSKMMFAINLDSLTMIESLCNKTYMHKVKEQFSKLSNKQTKPKEDDLATLIYTSGTTGHSKGVMLSHKNLVTNAMSAYKQVKVYEDDVFLSILPLAHTLECTVGLLIPVLHGASVYYIDKVPTPSVLLKALKVVKPTMMISVPLIIEKIYKNKIVPKFTSSFLIKALYSIGFIRKRLNKIAGQKLIETFGGRLRFFGIGGAGISPYVEQFLIEAEFPYIIGYGLTETAPLLSAGILGGTIKHRSAGVAMSGVKLKIKNPDPKTKKGEILASSPSVMMGYYKDEEQTKEVMDGEWFCTGDLGYIDDDGYLFISGRSKNVIIGSGGENIFPEQIEATINQHDEVLDSLVMMQNDKLIAKIHLDYELIDKKFNAHKNTEAKLREDIEKLLEDMRLEVNSKISSYSRMIKFVEQIEPFVKTPTKKIKRYLYQE
jgi:long-chain acyl-CoA synthetase